MSYKPGKRLYQARDTQGMGDTYIKHVAAMTDEGLHIKGDIAAELAIRDVQILALLDVIEHAVENGMRASTHNLMQQRMEGVIALSSLPTTNDVNDAGVMQSWMRTSPVDRVYGDPPIVESAQTSMVDPTRWDDSGVLRTVPPSCWTVQEKRAFTNGTLTLSYGTELFPSRDAALIAARDPSGRGYPLVSRIAVAGDATDLIDRDQASEERCVDSYTKDLEIMMATEGLQE